MRRPTVVEIGNRVVERWIKAEVPTREDLYEEIELAVAEHGLGGERELALRRFVMAAAGKLWRSRRQ